MVGLFLHQKAMHFMFIRLLPSSCRVYAKESGERDPSNPKKVEHHKASNQSIYSPPPEQLNEGQVNNSPE